MGNVYKYNRKSLRLKHYDYSREGCYFITIVTQNREHLFGEIVEGEIVLNEAGRMIEKWYIKLEEKFQNIQNHEMVIMPNHIHFIIEIVGADPCVRPNMHTKMLDTQCKTIDAQSETIDTQPKTIDTQPKTIDTQSKRADTWVRPYGLGDVVQWFKTMTTNAYIKMVKNGTLPPFNKRIWQRNYYEHVVRDDADYVRLATYIQNNPLQWKEDMFSP